MFEVMDIVFIKTLHWDWTWSRSKGVVEKYLFICRMNTKIPQNYIKVFYVLLRAFYDNGFLWVEGMMAALGENVWWCFQALKEFPSYSLPLSPVNTTGHVVDLDKNFTISPLLWPEMRFCCVGHKNKCRDIKQCIEICK